VRVPVAWPLTDRSKELRFIEAAISDRDSSGICHPREACVQKSQDGPRRPVESSCAARR
jgi:hypothetical protein